MTADTNEVDPGCQHHSSRCDSISREVTVEPHQQYMGNVPFLAHYPFLLAFNTATHKPNPLCRGPSVSDEFHTPFFFFFCIEPNFERNEMGIFF